nr:GNAT family N-acetyltransferase [Bacilli bacterium]
MKISLRPYELSMAKTLADLCRTYYAKEIDDAWRRYEWPFCESVVCEQYALDFISTFFLDGSPTAYGIYANRSLIGMIALTQVDEQEGNAQLGTYITPLARGHGYQLVAKELLFAKLPTSLHTLYCFIEDTNRASIASIQKIRHQTLVSDLSSLPKLVTLQCQRIGKSHHIYRIDLSAYRPSS